MWVNLSIQSCSSEAEPASFLKMSYGMLVSRTHLVTHTDMLWLCKATVATAGSCITRWLFPLEKYCHGSKLVRYSENGTHWRSRGEGGGGPTGISRTTDSLPHSVSPGLGVTASPSSPPCLSFLVAICNQPSHLG